MGLDMFIFKRTKQHASLLKRIASKESSLNKFIDDRIKTYKDRTDKAMSKFLSRHSVHFRVENQAEEMRLRLSLIIFKEDPSNIKWNIFNNMTLFKFGLSEEIKNTIWSDFLKTFEYLKSAKAQKLNQELASLSSSIEAESTELAYWRKYHSLNTFILKKFGGGNCEDTILTLESMETIRDFINQDYQTSTMIDEIINQWDESATYAYHPWW